MLPVRWPFLIFMIWRVIALPSIKYSGRVKQMYLNRDLGGVRWVVRQPVTKITIDTEPCMTMLLEKLRKSERSLGDCCLCMQHMFKD